MFHVRALPQVPANTRGILCLHLGHYALMLWLPHHWKVDMADSISAIDRAKLQRLQGLQEAFCLSKTLTTCGTL